MGEMPLVVRAPVAARPAAVELPAMAGRLGGGPPKRFVCAVAGQVRACGTGVSAVRAPNTRLPGRAPPNIFTTKLWARRTQIRFQIQSHSASTRMCPTAPSFSDSAD